MSKVAAILGAVALSLMGFWGAVALAGDHDKITICHAAGQEGTTHFITLTISEEAVYGHNGNAGHFEENGTTKAGHEQDYFGPCNEEPPTTTGNPPPPPTTTETTPPPPPPTTTVEQPKCVPTGAGQDGNIPPGGNTNDNCLPLGNPPPPPVTTTAPPPPTVAVTPPPPPVTTTTTPAATPKPPKEPRKPAAKQKAKPKPPAEAKPPAPHVCKTLKDGTERAWYDGGNGMKPGCYAIVRGSG